MMRMVQCFQCIHWIGKQKKELVCEAFPSGIPLKIKENKFNHREPYKGDNGIQFEPIKK